MTSILPDLLDELMPEFDFGNRHAVLVEAPQAVVARAAETYRLDRSPIVRLLFRLRGLGAAPGLLRTSMTRNGFSLLAERPGHEVVMGVAGRFWALAERDTLVSFPDARAFVDFNEPGHAKAAVALRFEPLAERLIRLHTETRVACVDAAARRRFALYWTLIGPFSGWIRRDMLRGVRRLALVMGGTA